MEHAMRRRTLPLAMGLLLAVTACGPAQVVVTIQQTVKNPDGSGTAERPIPNVEVQLLPFDRDQVFDSLQKAFPTQEPPIPQELLTARDQVSQAQDKWQSATARWNTLRDTLEKITTTMKKYSRGESRYIALYRQFQDFDAELSKVDKEMKSSFARYDSLQKATIHQSDSIRVLRNAWADSAFASVDSVFAIKLQASGLQAAVDTTDANGVASKHLQVKPGKYWVTARFDLPYTELYWNVPIEVKRGKPVQVLLNNKNAKERVKL
jgi:DNA repair ATPase RecN